MPPETIWQVLYQTMVEFVIWVVAPVLTALTIWKFIG